ncbi:hypothetical protein Ancab_017744 [Ancistrocladus abbreviatus]
MGSPLAPSASSPFSFSSDPALHLQSSISHLHGRKTPFNRDVSFSSMSTEPAPSAGAAAAALIKDLASCNGSIRARAVKRLTTWLPTQDNLSEDDMKKLWKAIFYCVWHSDKVSDQHQLIDRLSSLILSLSPSLSLLYFSHFLIAMRREWTGIDHLRLDKFYLLIRVFLRHLFILVKRSNWELEILEKYMRVLEERAFCAADDKGLGYGVSYQIVSVFCSEIKPFLPLKLEVLNELFSPFVRALGRTDNKVLVGKIKNDVFDYVLRNGKNLMRIEKSGGEFDLKDEMVLFGAIALVMRFSAVFYDLGSSPDCAQRNRKILFGLHEAFLKLEKEMESSGIDISVPEVSEDQNGGEMPTLIPINNEITAAHVEVNLELRDAEQKSEDESSDKSSKKSKKEKKATKSKKATKKKQKKIDGLTDHDGEGVTEDKNDEEIITSKGDNLNAEPVDNENMVTFDESVISNLQKQFEKVAAEAGLDGEGASSLDSPTSQVNGKLSMKRKRVKSVNKEESLTSDMNAEGNEGTDDDAPKTGEKSVKKVKFSMKNNLIWKPHNPLPPQSLRLPPSVTPRGSALKKGVLPGPIKETSLERKKVKKKLKKVKRVVKSVTPAVKHVKKLKSLSV